MTLMGIERHLVTHCAPTLASLKTANLFTMACAHQTELDHQIDLWNEKLQNKGLFLLLMRCQGKRALIYVCRKSHLQADLQKPGVYQFLKKYGYPSTDVTDALGRLLKRMQEGEGFPHEIGLFLGYPLGDVIGFIQNEGKNSKCVGCWKVYCDECEAKKRFAQFKKCRQVYGRLWSQGRTICQLTVAA